MTVSNNLENAQDGFEAQRCFCSIGAHCLIVEQEGNEFVVRYYLHRLEVGPQQGDKELVVRGLTSGQKEKVVLTERPLA